MAEQEVGLGPDELVHSELKGLAGEMLVLRLRLSVIADLLPSYDVAFTYYLYDMLQLQLRDLSIRSLGEKTQ